MKAQTLTFSGECQLSNPQYTQHAAKIAMKRALADYERHCPSGNIQRTSTKCTQQNGKIIYSISVKMTAQIVQKKVGPVQKTQEPQALTPAQRYGYARVPDGQSSFARYGY